MRGKYLRTKFLATSSSTVDHGGGGSLPYTKPSEFPDDLHENHNYFRNPNGDEEVWCYKSSEFTMSDEFLPEISSQDLDIFNEVEWGAIHICEEHPQLFRDLENMEGRGERRRREIDDGHNIDNDRVPIIEFTIEEIGNNNFKRFNALQRVFRARFEESEFSGSPIWSGGLFTYVRRTLNSSVIWKTWKGEDREDDARVTMSIILTMIGSRSSNSPSKKLEITISNDLMHSRECFELASKKANSQDHP
ncbi:unnamed protein product [Darwinula stevensoni]|uniref:Uncharacterized protein n=1 Tax=Darwinula stevensoni TaxID=69355 RepID=A0A7R9A6L4_9CRUS|nr:unnamed protein product [Darwinula stevensoni]CAG0889620.1 unnamed protein product [Darwinula stevensoni]